MKKLIFLLLLIPLIGLSNNNDNDSLYAVTSVNKDTIYIAMDTDIGKLIHNIWITKPLPKQPTIIKTTQKQLKTRKNEDKPITINK